MSVGLALLRSVLDGNATLSFLLDQGLDRASFIGDEVRVFDVMYKHADQFGQLPKLATIVTESGVKIPTFPAEPIGFWLDRVEARKSALIALDVAKQMEKAVSEGRIDRVKELAQDLYLKLGTHAGFGRVVDANQIAPQVMEDHDRLQLQGKSLSGVPFGIDYLDAISGGAQPGDTIAIVGRPGKGKSLILAKMGLHCFERQGIPLVVTLEMPALQWVRRMMAIHSSVPATALRLGRMSFWARKKVMADIGSLLALKGRPFYIMEGTLSSTVEDIAVRARELRPSALYVDGAYLLRLKGKPMARWERVTETAEWLKMISNDLKIPSIATYQFNRKGAGSIDNIGQSDAIGQLASVVISLDDDNLASDARLSSKQYKTLELLKGREGETGLIRILFDMERMIIQQESVLRGYELETDGEDKDF